MKTRAIILAGGEGTRLGVLTARRAKPAVLFAGKYRIIDFTLSNCVNSNLFDVMIIAQYRPHSLIEHIGAGGPWDLNRDFTGGVRVFTPFKAPTSNWFIGTADAVQQNFTFIKRGNTDLVLILSGDHIYTMDYERLISFHMDHQADLTMATISVPKEEASRFGIVGVDRRYRVTSFVEKPANPPSSLANMGIYVFNRKTLDEVLWEDRKNEASSHDFGKDIIPAMIKSNASVFAYPYTGYWMDVGTIQSYWKAHMDLIETPPAFDLYDPDWIIHTRTEERPPVRIHRSAVVEDSLICNGCTIEPGARVIRSVLSPGVVVKSNAVIEESIIMTDTIICERATIERSVLDKRVKVGANCKIGACLPDEAIQIAMIGKASCVPPGVTIEAGGIVGTDVVAQDYSSPLVRSGEYIQTGRQPYEI
jgi:glucose-1-phosphate adenylyltransferase